MADTARAACLLRRVRLLGEEGAFFAFPVCTTHPGNEDHKPMRSRRATRIGLWMRYIIVLSAVWRRLLDTAQLDFTQLEIVRPNFAGR